MFCHSTSFKFISCRLSHYIQLATGRSYSHQLHIKTGLKRALLYRHVHCLPISCTVFCVVF